MANLYTEDGVEMKLQADEEGVRAIRGFMLGLFIGGMLWMVAGYYAYIRFIA